MSAFLQEARALLAELVAIPTVSAEGRALREGAERVAGLLEALGLRAELHGGYGPPVVYAEGGEGEKTLLFTTTTMSSLPTPWSSGRVTPLP